MARKNSIIHNKLFKQFKQKLLSVEELKLAVYDLTYYRAKAKSNHVIYFTEFHHLFYTYDVLKYYLVEMFETTFHDHGEYIFIVSDELIKEHGREYFISREYLPKN